MKNNSKHTFILTVLCILPLCVSAGWSPATGPLMTRWAADVSSKSVLPEYPRPQMVRKQWLNLNGLWDYSITAKDDPQPVRWDGRILVPFPVESALSGVMKPVNENQRLWYHRVFKLPRGWGGKKILLHFGAVDWETTVWVNGQNLGVHRGGYDGFSYDITEALKPGGAQEIVVSVFDPSDTGTQPRGKQSQKPSGIWYTPASGIWQTVWLEPVAAAHIDSLTITPDLDDASVSIRPVIGTVPAKMEVRIKVFAGRSLVQSATLPRDNPAAGGSLQEWNANLKLPAVKTWSPDSPFLYSLQVAVLADGKVVDQVQSYFGMRKIALGKDEHGVTRIFLNNQPLFQFGPLDQGFWPDGLYTAPTDEALRSDLELTKKLGFNMCRKHVKVEPERWYYWCDQLGLLVWQDMPSGDKSIAAHSPDAQRSQVSTGQFETELKALIAGRFNHPCIVMWIPFNEGWGQFDTVRIVNLVKAWDGTRLVDDASGWTDRGVGDVVDMHKYPGPDAPPVEKNRAAVLGEFGGLGLPVKGHTWQDEKNWGYKSFKSAGELEGAYVGLIQKLVPLVRDRGLSAAVYTQTTDVEVEVNGLMTYDRRLLKLNPTAVRTANLSVYEAEKPISDPKN